VRAPFIDEIPLGVSNTHPGWGKPTSTPLFPREGRGLTDTYPGIKFSFFSVIFAKITKVVLPCNICIIAYVAELN